MAIVVAVDGCLFGVDGWLRAASPSELLEKGIYTEDTKGDVKGASQIYQQIANDPSADRRLVAQAQLRLGLCQLKLGNKRQAISALDRLTSEFPDKDKLLEIVEQHMPQLLDEIVQQIERNYIQEIDRNELVETAIRAIAGKLDAEGGFLRPNDLEFLSAEQLKEFNTHVEQKIVGIGAVLKVEAGEVVVQSPLPGSPAYDGGLRAEDRIVSIDGEELPPNQLAKVVQQLRGAQGTEVTVGVKRPGSDEIRELTLTRNTIRLPSVTGYRRKPDQSWDFMFDEQRKIGYARLSALGKESAGEMKSALEDLKGRGMKGLVLDLRSTPGGLLDAAVAVSDLFAERGRILTVKSRKEETTFDAEADGTFTGFPVALLANRNTASAAEIIAAALQDHQRAVVIGERTAGHGVVKSLFPLGNGVGAVKLPVATYYRPSGKAMNRYPHSKESDDWGVRPNDGYEVAFSEEESKAFDEDRFAHNIESSEATSKTKFEDRQLQMAIEYLEKTLQPSRPKQP